MCRTWFWSVSWKPQFNFDLMFTRSLLCRTELFAIVAPLCPHRLPADIVTQRCGLHNLPLLPQSQSQSAHQSGGAYWRGRGRNSVRFHRLSTPAASQSKGHLLLVSNKIVPFKYILYLYHSEKYVLKQIEGSLERLLSYSR